MINPQKVVSIYIRERGAARELAATTQRTARYVLLGFVECCPPDLTRTTRRHVTTWMDRQSHLADSTLATNYGTVRAFCSWLVLTRRIRRDPTLGIRGPNRPRRRPRALPLEDVETLLVRTTDPRLRVAVSLMLMEGLRLAEVTGLQFGDVDFGRQIIHVIGKGAKPRVVPLTETTETAIRLYDATDPAPMVGPLIRSQQDPRRPISPNRLGRLVSDLMADAGVKARPRDGRSAHALRHTAATDTLAAGATVSEVRDLLGHSTVATTQVYLAPVEADAVRPALERRPYARRLSVVSSVDA